MKLSAWRALCGTLAALALIRPSLPAQTPTSTDPHARIAQVSEQITVSGYRTAIGLLESPVSTRSISSETLRQSAGFTLDGAVRQIPGVETFRRSSSLVANPSSQGISLRGLGSTSASRTLLVMDDVPLNDPIGGWIHWLEQPAVSIDRVELVRGGASDLYGSSAIGGVVSLVPARPSSQKLEVRYTGGGEGTYDTSALAQTKHGVWGLLGAGGATGTDGYIQMAPAARGPADIASNVHAQNALLLADHDRGPLRLFLRGSGFDESRGNGTPLQTNGTRLWRYATGADLTTAHGDTGTLRVYGSTEHYRQTFTSISSTPVFGDPTCTKRCGETLNRLALLATNELGAAAHYSRPFGVNRVLLTGADTHDIRYWDREQTYGNSAQLTNLSNHQRDSSLYALALWSPGPWTFTAAAREDWFQNFDGNQRIWSGSAWTPGTTQPPQFSQAVFNPRLGLSRKLGRGFALSASGFRAFRAPTPSELYRSTQVGNKLTLPNGSLLSERATGWEAGIALQQKWGVVRASWFLTQVNRPIVAVTTNPTSSPILLQRQNLGQIESRGISLDFELTPWRFLSADGGYQYARATVTRGTQDIGNWIPEVARNLATLNLCTGSARWGTLSLQSRLSGRMFDDDANAYLLHGYFRLDAYAAHRIGPRFEIFASGENLFDRAIEVSKTPSTTLSQPRTARVGLTLSLTRAQPAKIAR